MKGQTYGIEDNTIQKVTPTKSITDSDFICLENFRCHQRPVVATMTTRPKTIATTVSSSAMTEIAAAKIEGNNQREPNTPSVIATDPMRPIKATRKLVNCKRVAARLIVFGITVVTANAITNQIKIASNRVPKNSAENCGCSTLNGSRMI